MLSELISTPFFALSTVISSDIIGTEPSLNFFPFFTLNSAFFIGPKSFPEKII